MYLLQDIYFMHKNALFLKVFFKLTLFVYIIYKIFNTYNYKCWLIIINITVLGRISKTDKATWSVLLKILTNSGLLTNVLQCLVIQNSRIAALWVIELCMVIYRNNKKIKTNRNQNYDCMNCRPLNLDANLVLRIALNSPHSYTVIFLKW